MEQSLSSFIAICANIEALQEQISKEYPKRRVCTFIRDEFLLEDAKAVVKEAYIAEKDTKILLLSAKRFRIETQNALLKILEEPPLHVMFIVAVASKTTLLPTIRSRLPLRVFSKEKLELKSGLNFKRLSLGDIYVFLKDKKYISKQELCEYVQCITKEACEQGVEFSHEELDLFAKLFHIASLNSRPVPTLTTQLLTILTKV